MPRRFCIRFTFPNFAGTQCGERSGAAPLLQTNGRMKKLLTALGAMLWAIGFRAQTYKDYVQQGLDAMSADSLAQAEALFRKALEAEPAQKSNALLFGHIGRIQERQRRYDEALESYTLGINLSPHTMGLLLDRASLYMRLGREEKALTDYSDVLDLNPDHREALLFRAYIYVRQRLFKRARQDYDALLKLEPTHEQGLLGLALLNDKDNRPREAMEIMNRLVALYSARASIYAVRGGMEQARKQYELAQYDLDKAVELEPQNPEYYLCRAGFYMEIKKKKLARADLEAALRLGASREEVVSLLHELAE